jgi:hypothetical protein
MNNNCSSIIVVKSFRARKATKSLLKISTNANRKSNVKAENHISGIESTNTTFQMH